MNKNLILPPVSASLLFTGSYIAGKYAIVDLGPITASLWRMVYSLVSVFVAISARIVFNEPIAVIMLLSMGLILLGLQFTLK